MHALIAPYRFHSIYVTGTISLNLLEQALAEATEKELANICYVFLSDWTPKDAMKEQLSSREECEYTNLCGQFHEHVFMILPFCAPSMRALTLVSSGWQSLIVRPIPSHIVSASLQELLYSLVHIQPNNAIFPALHTVRLHCQGKPHSLQRLVQEAVKVACRHSSLRLIRIEGFELRPSKYVCVRKPLAVTDLHANQPSGRMSLSLYLSSEAACA
jgi:hypothetical protein